MCSYCGLLSGLFVTWGFYFTMCTYRGRLSGLFATLGFLFHCEIGTPMSQTVQAVYLPVSTFLIVCDLGVSISLCILTVVHSLNCLQPQGFSPSMYHTASGLSVLGL